MPKLKYDDPEVLFNQVYGDWLQMFINIATSSFIWEGLPEDIPVRYLESVLFWNGGATGFIADGLLPVIGQLHAEGRVGIYDEPTRWNAEGADGRKLNKKPLNHGNAALIYNNYARTPDLYQIIHTSKKLAEMDRIIDVNVRLQKTSGLITCTDRQRQTLMNIYRQYEGNAPMIFSTKNLDPQDLKFINTGAPFVAPQIQNLKRQELQQALARLGIEANMTEKAERLVTGEASGNLGFIEACRMSRLEARKAGAKQLQKIFGDYEGSETIDVRFQSSLVLSQIMDGVILPNGQEAVGVNPTAPGQHEDYNQPEGGKTDE